LFGNPIGRMCMEAFGALPIYRQQDKQPTSAATDETAARNEATFARCRALLRDHQALALFPEGITHSATTLQPLRTGAARIALSAEAEADWQLGLQIVPIGLWYQNKTLFRSAALLVVGQPFTIRQYAAMYAQDERAAVQALTQRIADSLDPVVLQAENAELLAGIPVLANWTAPAHPLLTLDQQHARSATLLNGYRQLAHSDPQRLAALAQEAQSYARTLRMLGIDDPWALELAPLRRGRIPRLAFLLVLGFVPALAGFILSYGPYRLAGVLTPRLVGHHDTLIGTGKLIVGSALVLLGWIAAAVLLGAFTNILWGMLLLILAPALAYIALRWGESWHELRETLTYDWLHISAQPLMQQLRERRQALAAHVWEAEQALVTEQVIASQPDQQHSTSAISS